MYKVFFMTPRDNSTTGLCEIIVWVIGPTARGGDRWDIDSNPVSSRTEIRLSATPSLLVYRWRVRLQRKQGAIEVNGEPEVAQEISAQDPALFKA